MAGYHRDRAELTHCPRIAQQHAVQHAPFDIRQSHAKEGLQTRRAERDRGLFLLRALFLHQRNQRARDKRKRHENGRQRNAGHREQHMDVMALQPWPPKTLRAEQQHEDEARDHRTDRERQIDQRDQESLAAKVEFGDRPGRDQPEHQIEADRNHRDHQRQPDRRQCFRIGQCGEISTNPLGKGLREHDHERQHDEDGEEDHGHRDDDAANKSGLGAQIVPCRGR